MRAIPLAIAVAALMGAGMHGLPLSPQTPAVERASGEQVNTRMRLPKPTHDGMTSVERALSERRSVREYSDAPLTIAEVSQLLWASQGITAPQGGFRAAPSAGALYPLETYVVIGAVEGAEKGVYRYEPREHELVHIRTGDVRTELAAAALGQASVAQGAIVVVYSAVYERTTQRYGDRGIRYVHMEAGHAAQNLCLQAVSLKLGSVPVGAFKDDAVRRVLAMPESEDPLYMLPVGRMRVNDGGSGGRQ